MSEQRWFVQQEFQKVKKEPEKKSASLKTLFALASETRNTGSTAGTLQRNRDWHKPGNFTMSRKRNERSNI
eukprot:3858212-Rhodomonas_salina.1